MRIASLLSLLLLAAAPARAAELDYRGQALSRRQAETLLAPALRAPSDSAALSEALGRLVAHLQGMGHLDARAEGAWTTGKSGSPALQVEAREGRRYRWSRLVLDASSPAESTAFAAALGIRAGDWASPSALAEATPRALRQLAESGHPYAQLGVSELAWDSAGARLRLSGSLGPRVTVSAIRFEGLRATRARVAEQAMGRLAGRPFSPAGADAARDRLSQLGLFRRVEYLGLEGEPDWGKGRLAYRVEEPAYNRFEGAIGIQREGRAAGRLRLELDNLAGTGRAVALGWESRGRPAEALEARYREPLLFGTPLRVEAMLEHRREDSLFIRDRFGARLSFLLPGQERLEAGYEQDRVLDRRAEVEEADVQSTVFALERDTRDAVLTPRRGARLRIAAAQSFKRESLRPSGRRTSRASAAEGLFDWHRALGPGHGLAWRLSGAARFSSERVLPVYERYTLGGAATLRGHDEQAQRVDRYGLSRLEWRWFAGAGGQHLALFWDHAWTFTRLPLADGDAPDSRHRDGVGLGVRVESPAGVIGVDYGLEPGRSPSEGKLHLQLVSSF